MEIWLCSLTHAAQEHADIPAAMTALRDALERERRAGRTVKPAEVSDRVGQVYTARDSAGLERYWLSRDKPE